jgi:hypothetical protein
MHAGEAAADAVRAVAAMDDAGSDAGMDEAAEGAR